MPHFIVTAAQALSALRSAFGGLSIRDCSRSALELEVVEVKNACPYRQVTTVTRKGRAKISYVLADGGPHRRVCTAPFSMCLWRFCVEWPVQWETMLWPAMLLSPCECEPSVAYYRHCQCPPKSPMQASAVCTSAVAPLALGRLQQWKASYVLSCGVLCADSKELGGPAAAGDACHPCQVRSPGQPLCHKGAFWSFARPASWSIDKECMGFGCVEPLINCTKCNHHERIFEVQW